MSTFLKPARNLLLFVALSFLCGIQNLQAQLWKKMQDAQAKANQTTQTVVAFTALAVALHNLKFVTNRNTKDFNQNVTVSKGNDAQTVAQAPPKKMNPPVIVSDSFTNLKWEPVTYFNGQLYPSTIICMASYSGKDLQGQLEAISRPVGFRIISPLPNMPIKYEIECVDKKYFDKVDGTVLYTNTNKETDVMPAIPWNYESLARQNSAALVSINFRLYDNKGNKIEKTVSLSIASINECVFQYKDMPLVFLFAGFVQEQHPEIDKIVQQASDTKMASAMNGYQGGETNVDAQVAAVWRTLHDRNISYSGSMTAPSADNQDIRSQQVRTFDNSIRVTQGNCVDGTIVFASVLRKLGIHSSLIFTPTHCLLGYYTDDSKNNVKYVETTMLSQTSYIDKKTGKTVVLAQAKTVDQKNQAYMGLFRAATDKGALEYKEAQVQSNSLTLVDIDETRDLVKSPIPFYTN